LKLDDGTISVARAGGAEACALLWEPCAIPNRMLVLLSVAHALLGCNDFAQPAPEKFRYVVVDRGGPVDPWGKAAGDLNGDGLPDLIVGGRSGGGLVWYENPGWSRHDIAPTGAFSTDHEVADIDGDGRNDLVSLTYDRLVWFRGPEWARTDIAGAHLHDIEIADLDGDGRPDVVGRGQRAFGDVSPGLHLYFQQDAGWENRDLPAPPGEGLKVSDIDGDGLPDVVISGRWLRNPGSRDGEWRAHRLSESWDWPDAYVATGDVNGDGRTDVVLAPAEVAGARYRLSWFEAPPDPTGDWREHVVLPDVEAVHHFVGVADFDLDGRVDIATAAMHQARSPAEVVVLLRGAASVGWTKLVLSEHGSHNMRILDVDGDGDPDLFGANWSGDHQPVELWLNRRCSPEQGCAGRLTPTRGD